MRTEKNIRQEPILSQKKLNLKKIEIINYTNEKHSH